MSGLKAPKKKHESFNVTNASLHRTYQLQTNPKSSTQQIQNNKFIEADLLSDDIRTQDLYLRPFVLVVATRHRDILSFLCENRENEEKQSIQLQHCQIYTLFVFIDLG